jgi:hypothetical protein
MENVIEQTSLLRQALKKADAQTHLLGLETCDDGR